MCRRVVVLDHCARLSGGEIALARLLDALGGLDVHVILGEDGPLVARLERTGATVEILPLAPSAGSVERTRVTLRRMPWRSAAATARHVWLLSRRLRDLHPDVVHTNSLKSGVYGGLAARLAGVPQVWHVRDRLAPDYLPGQAATLIRAMLAVLPAAVVANSRATLATLGRRVAARPTSHVIYEAYRPALPPVPRPDGFTVGLVGRMAPWKGQLLFLDAFARLAAEAPDARAVLIGSAMFGEDAYEAEVKRRVADPDLDGKVAVLGFCDDVEAQLARLSVLVHASTIPEPFGQVVLEGLAAGLPVVAPDEGGPAEIIADGRSGLLYRRSDIPALHRALRRLYLDPGLRERLAAGALVRATDFVPEVIAGQVRAVYDQVAGPISTAAAR